MISEARLARLGDKLDATEGDGSDSWVALFFEYEALAIAFALATKQPKVKIKSTGDFWAADALWGTLWDRIKAIKADRAANSASGSRRMRTAADLKALLAVAERDLRIYSAAIQEYKANKTAIKERWQQARRAVRIPARDLVPQR
jgi:hypothetical protein